MAEFRKYMHVEKLGTTEVNGILDGTCHIFPKIDGTNGSIWKENDTIKFASRKRELIDSDNRQFKEILSKDQNIINFFDDYGDDYILYGEWLVHHNVHYNKSYYNHFYIFDVYSIQNEVYIHYDEYTKMLDKHNLLYIPVINILDNPTIEQLNDIVVFNTNYLEPKDDKGEGIVIKRYDFVNRYGRTTWAKIVRAEFIQNKSKKKQVRDFSGIETDIVNKYITQHFVDKTFAKVVNDNNGEWNSKLIGKFLGICFHDFITENTFQILKDFKYPIIDFKKLRSIAYDKIKSMKKDIFGI